MTAPVQTSKSRLELDGHAYAWVAATLVLAVAPHMSRLPAWLNALTLAALLWKWWLVKTRRPPGRWHLVGAALLVTAGILLSFGGVHGRLAGSALLVAMLSLKLVETRTRRDAALVVALCYFLIATGFLFTQSILVAAYMLLCIVIGTLTLMSLGGTARQAPIRHRLKLTSGLIALALPIAATLFILFPRLAGPLWHMPDDNTRGVTGISDSMRPGRISDLAQSDAPAFRVRFDGEPPPPEQRYWRGLVLWHYDGETWVRGRRRPFFTSTIKTGVAPISYTVTIEETGKRWLFGLDRPVQRPERGFLNASAELISIEPVITTRQYTMQSVLVSTEERSMLDWERRDGLQLPDGMNPRTLALGQSWRASGAGDEAIVDRALRLFRDQPFFYTLSPPLLGEHAIDDFLFDVRAGFCELYAASFVTLMRAAGIPARIVTGYLGGEMNSLGNYMIVRQADAHAWTEVWLDGLGWVRVDPTGSVAPERVDRGLDAAIADGESLPFLVRRGDSVWRDIRLVWDAMDNYWNEWVLGYGPELQKQLLERIGVHRLGMPPTSVMFLLIALILLPIGWSLVRRRPLPDHHDPVVRLYHRLCHQLARAGVERRLDETPAGFTARAARLLPDKAAQIELAGQLVNRMRYAPIPPRDGLRQLARLVRRLSVAQLKAARRSASRRG